MLFALAEMARKRLAKGIKLNYPEALALICDEVMEAAREGRSFEEAVARGMTALRPDDVMDGVADLLTRVQVEAIFDDGTKLVTLHNPIQPQNGAARAAKVGEVRTAPGPITVNEDKPKRRLEIYNAAPYPVWVGSHFPLEQANPRLRFDRRAAQGWRLNLPAGQVQLFPPGATVEVEIVPQGPHAEAGPDTSNPRLNL